MNRSTLIFTTLALSLGGLTAGCDDGAAACGDGRVVIPELCDDGNAEAGDGCAANCVTEVGWNCTGQPSVCREGPPGPICGDGVQDPGEACDERVATAACDPDCTDVECGDGVVNTAAGESCDDGNLLSGDGCSTTCASEVDRCGNGVCDFDEDCVICNADCPCGDCPDADEDGFADSACGGMDCNDGDAAVNPDATEVPCNRVDEDCDTSTVDALDRDGDGSSCNFDCDDDDPDRSPLFLERCGNGVDDDCDEDTMDVGDRDGDGFACDVDCDDFVATVCPDCDEVCGNVFDDDCDPETLDLFDTDEDGARCDVDCDDMNENVRPGNTEVCNNTLDDDCDETTPDLFDTDADGDSCATDCADDDPLRASTFSEICGNLIDDDCDAGTLDEEDVDGDTYSCVFDCDDDDSGVVPDANGFCGPRVMYTEDFEAGDGGWIASGSGSSWEHGTPSDTFINAAASGTSAWVTNLDGDYNAGEMSFLTSPSLDFSTALVDPILTFSHIYETEDGFDEGWLEVSTDGGTVWTKVGRRGAGTNWYNTSADTWDGVSGSAGAWRTARIPLRGTAGETDVRLRFAFDADGSFQEEGFGIDDVVIDNQIIDLGVTRVGLAATTCRNAAQTITATIINNGSVPATGFTMTYTLDGGTPVDEVVSDVVLPGATYTYAFATPADLDAPGARAIQIRVTIPMDAESSNDARSNPFTIEDVPFIPLGAGYFEDFESGPGAWAVSGLDSTWAHGTPSGTFISGAGSGSNAWVTNLFGNYNDEEVSRLTSGCFDFSMLSEDPTLSFLHIFQLGSFIDEGWIEVFRGSTGTWEKLGGFETGENWYDNFFEAWDGTSGSAGAWRAASHVLEDTAGESVVRIRHVMETDSFTSAAEGFGFDDVAITPVP